MVTIQYSDMTADEVETLALEPFLKRSIDQLQTKQVQYAGYPLELLPLSIVVLPKGLTTEEVERLQTAIQQSSLHELTLLIQEGEHFLMRLTLDAPMEAGEADHG